MDSSGLRKNKTSKTRVGVLRGGPSGEYEVSLKTGSAILEHMPQKYHPLDIYIDQSGHWHLDGLVCKPDKALKQVDIIVNGLHGEYGEDGKVQRLLEDFHIPYTGSDALSSAIAMNKILSKKIFERENLRTPQSRNLKKTDANYLTSFEIWNDMPKPLIVKPATAGSSLGVAKVETLEALSEALKNAFKYSSEAVIEEYIKGREFTCAVVEGLGALPPVEIRPTSNFFDYKAKYDGSTEEICPADISPQLASFIQELAHEAHRVLGLRHYSRTDMILGERGGVYILEVNTLPGLTAESLLPKSLKANGYSLTDFIDHLIQLSLNR